MSLKENNNMAAVGRLSSFESLCSGCMYQGCTSCPSTRVGSDEKVEKYPQVKKYVQGVSLVVLECDNYAPYSHKKTKVLSKENKFVWDPKTKHHIRKN